MNKIVTNFWTAAVGLIAHEKQPIARQDLAEKRLTPDLIEAAAQIIISKTNLAESDDAGKSKSESAIGALVESVGRLEKKFDEVQSGQIAHASSPATFDEKIQCVRNDLRKIEDKLDTLRPYALRKVAIVVALALLAGGVTGWYGRIQYRQWQYEQQQEAR